MDWKQNSLILWFDQITNDDVAIVGGKNASLGEMYTKLTPEGISVPNGFVVTANAYRVYIEQTGLRELIAKELENLDTGNIEQLQLKGERIRKAFSKKELPTDLKDGIIKAYKDLSNAYKINDVDVAVRSSATAEDLPGASFAGEHETYLNITGASAVIDAVRNAMASLFTARAISYRVDKGFSHFDVALSVGVQKMVRSDKGASGVMFTIDTETGFKEVVQIDSAWGLGEMVVQGKVTPDQFLVFKPTLKKGFTPIIRKIVGAKKRKMIYQKSKKFPVKEVNVSLTDRHKLTLNNDEVLTLANWGIKIEDHYSKRAGHPMPMDIEWAKDGLTGGLYIVQARPETVEAEKKGFTIKEYILLEEGEVLVEGIPVGTKIASGKARVILTTDKLNEFKDGEILVTRITDPDWEPIMKKASAIITEKGGRTSHAAIVSRELGIPAVIGVGNALSYIKTGNPITTDCSSGSVGRVYKGILKWEEKTHNLQTIPKVKTKISLNVGSPEGAFMHARLPNSGVGLAREEFIIASQIGIHPLALVHFEKIKNKKLKKKIENLTVGYDDKAEYFVEKLANGIAQICAAFYPEQVIVRFSDFKTNEYRTLIGGESYEPEEENPMLGWRGASRYTHPSFSPAFELECRAIKRVREIYGLSNLQTLIPFCRTPEEGQKVLDLMCEFGLKKGENGLMVYVMCELPTNVIRADDFLDVFDGFSIGSNDLAQTTLGLDRDSAIVAGISNENDPSVKQLVSQAIRACKHRNKYIGFCGQAPSDYPDFLKFLISEHIDSVSLNPDSVIAMTFEVAEEERWQGLTR